MSQRFSLGAAPLGEQARAVEHFRSANSACTLLTPQLIWKSNAGNASQGSASGTKLLPPATEKLTYLQESKTREEAARKEQETGKVPKQLKCP